METVWAAAQREEAPEPAQRDSLLVLCSEHHCSTESKQHSSVSLCSSKGITRDRVYIPWNLVRSVYTCQNKLIHFEQTTFLVLHANFLGAYLDVSNPEMKPSALSFISFCGNLFEWHYSLSFPWSKTNAVMLSVAVQTDWHWVNCLRIRRKCKSFLEKMAI